MLGLFSLFGRSAAMKALDHELREVGLHPLVVPEAVKITTLRLQKRGKCPRPRDAAYGEAAQLIAYCMLGRDQFVASNSLDEADRADRRVEDAVAAGDSLDAKLILLILHSGLIASDIAERFDVEDR
jgi:hypothetical protein